MTTCSRPQVTSGSCDRLSVNCDLLVAVNCPSYQFFYLFCLGYCHHLSSFFSFFLPSFPFKGYKDQTTWFTTTRIPIQAELRYRSTLGFYWCINFTTFLMFVIIVVCSISIELTKHEFASAYQSLSTGEGNVTLE